MIYVNFFLKKLFDIIPSPMFYKNKHGVYQHCNDTFSKLILGISKEEIIGKTLYDLSDVIPIENADIYSEKDKELFLTAKEQYYHDRSHRIRQDVLSADFGQDTERPLCNRGCDEPDRSWIRGGGCGKYPAEADPSGGLRY